MKFLQLPDIDKIQLINEIHDKTNLSQVIIEKDIWVTAVLRAIFALPYAEHLSFKGGTSLSKCWNLIDRFSEDIDIAINREYFGFFGDSFTVKEVSKKLRKASCKFVREKLQFDLLNQMNADGIPTDLFAINVDITPITTTDPEKIFIAYKSIFNPNLYIKNIVILEISGRSMKEPLQTVCINSIVNETFPTSTFAEEHFEIKAVAPERTFLEKICLLHEEFSKPNDLVRVDRMSRHLYDLSKILDTPIAENALSNKELYKSIIAHRKMFMSLKDFDYDTLIPSKINIIPPENIISQWEEDYNKMQTMIYNNTLSFSNLIEKLKQFNEKINQISF